MPRNATIADVDGIYKLAYKLECKGITVYRDGSRRGQPMSRNADGLSKAIIKYQQAKPLNGIKSLLLPETKVASGEICDTFTVKARADDQDVKTDAGHCVSRKQREPVEGFKLRCPCCDGILCFVEGCVKCYKCGFSQC
jgi:ribonucleoside-diphosphate reductase alpha chain